MLPRGRKVALPARFSEEADHGLSRLVRIGHDILDAAAKRRLDGDLVVLIHLDQVRHDAFDARIAFFLFHDAADGTSVAVIPLRDILKRFKPRGLPVVGSLPDLHLFVLLFQLLLNGPDLLLQPCRLVVLLADEKTDLLKASAPRQAPASARPPRPSGGGDAG